MTEPTPDPFDHAEKLLLEQLRQLAKLKGMTQDEIALATGWRVQNVNKILNGGYSPTLKNYLRLASAIGVNFFVEDKASQSQINQAHERAMEALGRRKPKNLN